MGTPLKYKDGQIVREDGKVLKHLSYNIQDKYVGELEKQVLVWVDPHADPDVILRAIWDEVDTGEDAQQALETADLCDANIKEPKLNSNAKRIITLRKAYAEAERQFECNYNQVSGVWRISGEDFCKEYGLDDGEARYEQDMENMGDIDEAYNQELGHIKSAIGDFDLTTGQDEHLQEYARKQAGCDTEGTAYWKNIMQQIQTEIDKLTKEESKDGDSKNI